MDGIKERPILFSGAMVLALLDGSKTQTRRIAKIESTMGRDSILAPRLGRTHAPTFLLPEHAAEAAAACPYGKPGDRLWVREAIRLVPDQEPDDGTGPVLSMYDADGSLTVADAWPWRRSYLPPMHCPRGLSRMTLEITDVRVERLQDISEVDAVAEGIRISSQARRSDACYGIYECRMPDGKTHFNDSAYNLYRALWEQINGAGSWDLNPFVWVVEFKVIQP